MPRYNNNGTDSNGRRNNDDRDRTVPDDENYYNPADFKRGGSFYNDGSVRDNQGGVNPCRPDEYENQNQYINYNNNNIDYKSAIDSFESERPQDFDNIPQRSNRSSSSRNDRNRSQKKSGRASGGKNSNNKKSRGKLSLGKRILIFILVIILILVGSIFPVLGRIVYDDKKSNEYVTSSDLESSAMVKNILLLGVDARSQDDDQQSRADTMMLVSIDLKHHCIKMTSFLRDTWVYIPCIDKEQRLNAACQYGGYNGVVDTIEYNFGVQIDNYVVADFEMFKILVDSIGGVEVDVSEKEAKEVTSHKKRYGNVTLESGKNTLTGEQALAYCRIRKIDTDFVRTKRQRTVMSAIFGKMKKTNPFTLYKMAFSAAPYIETDMSKAGLMSLVLKAGICMSSTHQTRVPFENTWEYATISGNSVISIDTKENKEKLIDFIYNKTSAELTSEEAAED